MATYKKVNISSLEEAAYIAGLIDGEGTVTLSRKHRNENRQLVVSISNTELRLLEFVLHKVGAGKITNKKTYSAKHTPSMTYTISNRQGLDLLKQICPYLKSYKYERTLMVLEHYVRLTPGNGKYTNQQIEERQLFIDNFLKLRSSVSRDKSP